jgi:ribosomal protein S24E
MVNLPLKRNNMESKIITEKKNPFMERNELVLEIKNNVAPSFDDVKSEIGKDADLTVVKKVNTNFGKQVFVVEAVVYDNAEAKEKVETIPQKVRKKLAEEKKTAEEAKVKESEAPAEEKAPVEPEAPAEETKEETPTEEKTE